MAPTFSLVIPTYNGEKSVEQTILSALNQVRPFDEIILSDDNSTDSTLEIAQKYSDRIKIHQNPEGPSGFVNGWNKGIQRVTGDYIAILHQDDLLDKAFLYEAEKALIGQPQIKHLFTTCHYIDEKNQIIGRSFENKEKKIVSYTGLEYVKAYQNIGDPHIHRCPGVITHRSIFEKIQYNPVAGHIADDDFFYRVGKYTDIMGILSPLASYRIHTGSETGSLKDVQLVRRLVDDYCFQLKQWKNDSFLDTEAFSFFVKMKKKYAKRLMGYGLKSGNLKDIIKGCSAYL